MNLIRYVIQQRVKSDEHDLPWSESNFNEFAHWVHPLPDDMESSLLEAQKEKCDELNQDLKHLEFRVVQQTKTFGSKVIYSG